MEFYKHDHQTTVKKVINWVVQIIVVIALAWFCVFSYGTKVKYTGQSMIPLLEPGESALVNRLSYSLKKPNRFDVIAFYDSSDNINIKRVIGLPNETILIKDGYIYINGKPLPDNDYISYISLSGRASDSIVLGDDEYFVLGDNTDVSEDSRFDSIGDIKKTDIIGKLWLRVSPIIRFGFIN